MMIIFYVAYIINDCYNNHLKNNYQHHLYGKISLLLLSNTT